MSAKPLLLVLLLALAAPSVARADEDCPTSGIRLFPIPGSVVPTNSRILLEGVGKDAERVWALAGREVVFRSKDDTVTVRVFRGWRSRKGRATVVLRPRALLKANHTYRLHLEAELPGARQIGGGRALVWNTGEGLDGTRPIWEAAPSIIGGRYEKTDAGVSRRLLLELDVKEQTPSYLLAEVWRVTGPSERQVYFIPVKGTRAELGHDTCGGAFALEDGKAYSARIRAYDIAGNATTEAKRLDFLAPRPRKRR